jgi:hypothetical protein
VPRRTTVKQFPFLEGQHQEIDSKILPDGYLSACKNVRLRKDGRFGVRADFDAIGNDTNTSIDVVPRDVVGFGDALCAFIAPTSVSGETATWDIADYTRQTQAEWKPSSFDVFYNLDTRLPMAVNVRTLPAVSGVLAGTLSLTRIDCAAAGGIVGIVYEDGTNSSAAHFFRASDGAAVLRTFLSGGRPRICSVGTTFFFTAFDGVNTILLAKYDPTTDIDKTDLTNITASSNGIYDLVTTLAGTGFWVAFNTSAPTTSIRRYNSSGALNATFVGPAVLYDYLSIRETLTRVHLVSVLAAGTCQLRSYTLLGALSTGPTTIVATSDRQPGISDATTGGVEAVLIAAEQTASPNSVAWAIVNALTHVVILGPITLEDSFLGAKPVSGGTPNYHHLFGAVVPDGSFFSTLLMGASRASVSEAAAYTNKFSATKPAIDHTPQIAKDSSTGKFYWPTLTVADAGIARPSVMEFEFPATTRRQTAQMAGVLYIGGGAIEAYDTRAVVSAGFFEKPRIISATPSNGAGALPSSTSLLVAITWEERDSLGNLIQSDISDVVTVTMGAADDTITLVTSPPHGQRSFSGAICVAYRSVSGISQLRRAESGSVGGTIVLLASDTTVRANGVIYTQAGRAALGAILPHEAPLPADFLWKMGSRLLAASADGAQVSKEIFPGAQVEWSGATGFTIPKISERITGVAALDQRGFLCTAERFYQFSGEGPNDAGEGRYSEPLPVPGSTGLLAWQSLVETPLGLFFQGSNGQLWVLPRDGSPPNWIGQPVRDVLVSFPTVTAAVLLVKEQLVSFTCNNTGGTDSRIVSYDLRAKTWIVDEFTSATPILSACSYQGRLAYLSSGVVYTEKTSLTPGTFIEHGVTTGTIKPFDWGKFCRHGLIGEYRGDCDIYARISHDDGKTFTTATKIQQLRAANYAVGDTVDLEWTPARWKTDGFRIDYSARTPGYASEGFVFNEFWIEYMPQRGGSRRAQAQRG